MKIVFVFIFLVSLVELRAQSADDLYNQGMEEWNEGHFDEAQKLFRKSLALDPKHYKTKLQWARMYVRARSYDLAMLECNKLIKQFPKVPDSYIERGDIYIVFGDPKKACKDFKKAKRLGSTQADEYLKKYCN